MNNRVLLYEYLSHQHRVMQEVNSTHVFEQNVAGECAGHETPEVCEYADPNIVLIYEEAPDERVREVGSN